VWVQTYQETINDISISSASERSLKDVKMSNDGSKVTVVFDYNGSANYQDTLIPDEFMIINKSNGSWVQQSSIVEMPGTVALIEKNIHEESGIVAAVIIRYGIHRVFLKKIY